MANQVHVGIAALLASCLSATSFGQTPANAEVTVDFRWLEPRIVEGVTEDQGHPIECDGPDWYAHRRPVLTSQDIAAARLLHLQVANIDQYAVAFTLTPAATKKLTDACGDAPGRRLTVYVNGRWYGTTYFQRAAPEKFSPPMAGYMPSKLVAEQILKASK